MNDDSMSDDELDQQVAIEKYRYRAEAAAERAKRTLAHYLSKTVPNCGPDNTAEFHEVVDSILDAAVALAKVEILRGV